MSDNYNNDLDDLLGNDRFPDDELDRDYGHSQDSIYPEEIVPELEEISYDEEAANAAVKAAEHNAMLVHEAEEETEENRYPELERRRRKNRKVAGKRTVAEEILDWLKTICIGIIAGVLLVVFVVQRDDVYGNSMYPTLHSGDVVFTQKIATYFKSYKRGDIVILDGKDMEGYDRDEYLIKRVVGLPGETVRIADGNVYIKAKGSDEFTVLQESYLPEGLKTEVRPWGKAKGYNEVTLSDDEYYCMGDNRPDSNDSRTLGPFTTKRIKGIAFIRLFPFNKIRLL